MLLVSGLSLIGAVVLYAYAPELRTEKSAGGNALSKSAIGFAGLRAMAEQVGMPVKLSRETPDADSASLIVLTPEEITNADDLEKLSKPGPRLVILPKWLAMPDPFHSGWVMRLGSYGPRAAGFIAKLAKDARVSDDKGKATAHLEALDERFDGILPARGISFDSLQTIRGPNLDPAIVDDKGRAVLAQIRGTQIFVLSDPDLLDNIGIHDTATARAALDLLWSLRVGDKPVLFDITLNGFHRSPDFLNTVFSPPFLGAALCAMLAAAFMAYHGFVRFGGAQTKARALAFGKRALADNTAAVIKLMHREPQMAPRYAQAVLNSVARSLGIPRERGMWVEALEQRNALNERFAELAADAAAVRDVNGLMKIAARLHSWRRGILHEHR